MRTFAKICFVAVWVFVMPFFGLLMPLNLLTEKDVLIDCKWQE